MNKIFFIILILINNLLANFTEETDLKVLKDLDIETSFINEPSFQSILKEYSSSQNITYYNNILKKSSLNAQIVREEIENENLPQSVFFIPMLESSFSNQINGKKNPAGIWQIMPQTATNLKLRNDEFIDERLDLVKSTTAASSYLKRYYKKLDKWYLALLAYNCGEGRVIYGMAKASLDKYLEENPSKSEDSTIKIYKNYLAEYKKNKSGLSDLYEIYNQLGKRNGNLGFSYIVKNNKANDYIPDSSLVYIQKIIAFSMIANRDLFKSIDKKSKYQLEKVKAHKGLQLKSLANIIGMNYNEFRSINKHIKKEALPTDSKLYNIYIPHDKVEIYNQKIMMVKAPVVNEVKKEVKTNVTTKEKQKKEQQTKKVTTKKEPIIYSVKKGDSFLSIAKKYNIDAKKLKADNNKKSNLIKVGEKIEIYK